jgi:hypothetical protein
MRFATLLLAILTCSCAKDGGGNASSSSGESTRPLSQRLNENNGYVVDSSGNWVPRNNRRSSFESQGQSPYFQGGNNNQGKDYKTGDYARKSWWGNKDYGRQNWQGKTDGTRFEQNSKLDGQSVTQTGAAARGSDAAYKTSTHATGNARESNARGLSKPSDAETDVRRRVYQEPQIVDWREQRSLSLDQSRGILGR